MAHYLGNRADIKKWLAKFKSEIEERLRSIYDGCFVEKGRTSRGCDSAGSGYLSYNKIRSCRKKTAAGKQLKDQSEVTDYILSEAKLAVVPLRVWR